MFILKQEQAVGVSLIQILNLPIVFKYMMPKGVNVYSVILIEQLKLKIICNVDTECSNVQKYIQDEI